MAILPAWTDDPDSAALYDRPLLDGMNVPGICNVMIDRAHNVVEVVKSNKQDVGLPVPRGKEAHTVSIQSVIFTNQHLQELDAFFKRFGANPGAKQQAVTFSHPLATLYKIDKVYITDYPCESPTSQLGMKFSLKLIQFVAKPPNTKVDKPKSAKLNKQVGGNPVNQPKPVNDHDLTPKK